MGPPPQVFGILLDDPLKHETLGKAARLALTAWLDGASEDLQKRSQLMAHHPEIATDLEQEFRRLTLIEKALHPGSARDEATLGTEVEEARSDAAFFILRCIRCGFSSGRIEQPELQSRALKTCPKCDFGPLVLEASDRLYAGKLIHQYRLQSPLGSGGFGSVWLAFDESLERQVALKIPHAKIATEAEREVFFREAKIAASVRHPMVVAVHDVGYFEDTVYICMEYLEGPPLTEWKLPHNNRSDAACELLQRLCEPVQAIHEAGIIHRDLKPSNIMIDDHGFPRLTDFGIAKPLDRQTQLTLTGQVLGTPSYMAPELAVGDAKHADARSDIYSMGVILYELLTEKLPLQIQTRADLDQIHKQKVPPPRSWNPPWNIPPDLEAICLKCLQKNPNDRYRHVSELADDLKRLGAGQPVLATPSSLTTSCYHYFQTRPTARLLGLLFLLTACVIPSLSMLIKRRGDVW